jgi:hypothetical protein
MKILTVIGRSDSIKSFESTLRSHLGDPFKIKGIIPLTQDDEAKNFLAYVDPGSDWREVEDEGYDGMADFLRDVGMYDVVVHEDPEAAITWVQEEYKNESFAPFKDPITAVEISKRDIFLGLVSTGEIGMVRALLDGKPVIALVHGVEGQAEWKDTLVTPYAIMVDDDLGHRLEMGFTSSYDD